MFRTQGNTLVRVLLSQLVAYQLQLILLLSFFLNALRFTCQRVELVCGAREFFSERVNLAAELLVLGLGLVEAEALVVHGVFLTVDLDILLLLVFGRQFLFLVAFLLLLQLLFYLLYLLVKCH